MNKIYSVGDTVVYNGLCGTQKAIIKIITNSPIYGIKHKTLREICSLKKFKCDNIIKLLDVRYIVNDQENVTILIYENCGVSLDYIDISSLDTQATIRDISYGLKHIHKLGYIHGDLKISNVIKCEKHDGSTSFKIIDFGNCTKTYRLSAISMPTPQIMPIEMLNFDKLTNTIGIDSWGLGCLAYHITTGSPLFIENNIADLKAEVTQKFDTCNNVNNGIKTKMLKHIDPSTDPYFCKTFVKNTSKLFNNNATKRFSVIQFYKSVYKSNSDDKLHEKGQDELEDSYMEECIDNKYRSFMMDILLGLNTENGLPIENIFITFQLVEKQEPKFCYKVDVFLLYTLVTKLICNSHFPTTSMINIIKKISGEDIDTIDINKKIGIILEHYGWDLDVKTLMSYLPELDRKLIKEYIVLSIFITYVPTYKGFKNSYKKELICHVLNFCSVIKSGRKKSLKLKKSHFDRNQIKRVVKLLRDNIDNGLIIGYLSSVNLLQEYKYLKMYLCNDISKFEI
jgi:serine/threonine protein kinase